MTAYCQPADLYDYGLPRGALPNPGRLIESVDANTEILTLDGHGFRADAELVFRAEDGGALPTPLVAGTTYYAIPLTDSTFSVAATPAGAAIDLTTSGSLVLVVTPLPFDAAIDWASQMVDDFLPAHVAPLVAPFPPTIVAVTADLAATRLLAYTGGAGREEIATKLAAAQKLLDRWAKGIPLRGSSPPPAANLAAVATVSAADPRGWVPEGGTLP